MIISRIFGGIGNQLFCYAAARRLALVNNAELVLDHVSGFERDYKYQRQYQLDNFKIPCRKATTWERMEPFSRIQRYLKRHINQRRQFERRNYIRQEGIDFDPRLLQLKPEGTLYLEGYWQSRNYFIDVEKTIRSDLRINSPKDQSFLEMKSRIKRKSSIAVHVRFFDEPGKQDIKNAPKSYYESAVEFMEKKVREGHYFLFSNKPQEAKNMIQLPDNRLTIVSKNTNDEHAYADLCLMTHCKHFIIANSTFSWWGAWLGFNENKQVVAPKFEMRNGQMNWGFKGLLPEDWIKL